MKRSLVFATLIVCTAAPCLAQGRGRGGPARPPQEPPATFFSKQTPPDLVEFDMMTWPEVYRAIHDQGKTTALFYTGGTESRGPQNVNGGHTIMARATVKAIAEKLGNAIAMPVLPYTPNNASNQLTGTIGLTNDILAVVLERVAQQAVATGFKNVVLMGDHGGGQPDVYRDVAKKLEDQYAAEAQAAGRPQDVHVYFCDEVYAKAQGDFDKYLESKGMPVSSHAGIPDTSEMMYLQGKTHDYTRTDLLPVAVTVPGSTGRGRGAASAAGGQAASAAGGQSAAARASQARPVPSGVSGDGRQSTVELGKMAFDMKVDYAVRQIRELLGQK